MGMGAGMGSAIVFCGDIGAISVGVDGGDDVMDAVGEVREFVTRRSSCIKRRNITPCPFETGAGQGKGVLLDGRRDATCPPGHPDQVP